MFWGKEMKLIDYLASILLAALWGLWLGYLIWGYK